MLGLLFFCFYKKCWVLAKLEEKRVRYHPFFCTRVVEKLVLGGDRIYKKSREISKESVKYDLDIIYIVKMLHFVNITTFKLYQN